MAIELLSGRLLVLPDEGSVTTGVIVQSNLLSYRGLTIPPGPADEDEPLPSVQYYEHIVFVKEMAVEVEINAVTYLAMHRNAIVAVLPN